MEDSAVFDGKPDFRTITYEGEMGVFFPSQRPHGEAPLIRVVVGGDVAAATCEPQEAQNPGSSPLDHDPVLHVLRGDLADSAAMAANIQHQIADHNRSMVSDGVDGCMSAAAESHSRRHTGARRGNADGGILGNLIFTLENFAIGHGDSDRTPAQTLPHKFEFWGAGLS